MSHNARMHDNPHKRRTGLNRLLHALNHSLQGLQQACSEKAFRQELLLSALLIPLAFVIGQNWVETALLGGSVVLVLMVEILNTGIEAAIDRIGPEWHELSKRAKDMGSAAVLLALVLCAGIWLAALLAWVDLP